MQKMCIYQVTGFHVLYLYKDMACCLLLTMQEENLSWAVPEVKTVPVMVEEFSSILINATFKLVLGKMVQRFNLQWSNLKFFLQDLKVVGLVLLEPLDQVGIAQEGNDAIRLILQASKDV